MSTSWLQKVEGTHSPTHYLHGSNQTNKAETFDDFKTKIGLCINKTPDTQPTKGYMNSDCILDRRQINYGASDRRVGECARQCVRMGGRLVRRLQILAFTSY